MEEHLQYMTSAIDSLNKYLKEEMPIEFCAKQLWTLFFLGRGFISNATLNTQKDVIFRTGMDLTNPYSIGEPLESKLKISGFPSVLGIIPLDSESEREVLIQIGEYGIRSSILSDLDFQPNLYRAKPDSVYFPRFIEGYSFNPFGNK